MGIDHECLYLVMELLNGESLADHLAREPVLSPAQALTWMTPIMGALATAHDRGITHRDVKPENVFLARRGRLIVPTLLDFGIAKHAAAGTLTESGVTIGTPWYMSPEQARGMVDVGPPSDVWALGVVLYRCLCGELPYNDTSPTGVLIKIVSERAAPLSDRVPRLDPALAHCVDRALSHDLTLRYPNVRAFAYALAACCPAVETLYDPDPVGLPDWRSHRISGRIDVTTHPGLPQARDAPPGARSTPAGIGGLTEDAHGLDEPGRDSEPNDTGNLHSSRL